MIKYPLTVWIELMDKLNVCSSNGWISTETCWMYTQLMVECTYNWQLVIHSTNVLALFHLMIYWMLLQLVFYNISNCCMISHVLVERTCNWWLQICTTDDIHSTDGWHSQLGVILLTVLARVRVLPQGSSKPPSPTLAEHARFSHILRC